MSGVVLGPLPHVKRIPVADVHGLVAVGLDRSVVTGEGALTVKVVVSDDPLALPPLIELGALVDGPVHVAALPGELVVTIGVVLTVVSLLESVVLDGVLLTGTIAVSDGPLDGPMGTPSVCAPALEGSGPCQPWLESVAVVTVSHALLAR